MSEILTGKRKRKSRLVNIDGHAVFKSNMYSLEDGEPSVWDTELGGGENVDEEERVVKVKPQSVTRKTGPPIIRNINPLFVEKRLARQSHNQSIKDDIDKRKLRRQEFLRLHWNQISPFVDPRQTCPEAPANTIASHQDEYLPFLSQPPWLKGVQMRDYQLEGVNWLIKSYGAGTNVILGDEMGLGKTIQTIVYLGWMKYTQQIHGPHLIVVPLSVLSNWITEFRRFLPGMRVLRLHSGDRRERDRLKGELQGDLVEQWDVVVTTYEMVKNPSFNHALVSSIYWRVLVLDEGHIVRNEETRIANTVRGMHFEQAILLTGTPLQNNLHELWSLLNFLQPDVFASSERFDACFNISGATNYRLDTPLLLKVHQLLRSFMLRRIKTDVERTVPPKVEKKVMCPLTPVQAHWYKRFLLKDSSLLGQLELESCAETGAAAVSTSASASATRWKKLQSLFMQLRKVCNHPFLFDEADPDPEVTDERVVQASGKLQVLDRLLLKLRAAGHRVVLFSQFTRVLDILGDYLNYRGFEFCRLDGSSNRIQRQVDINSFNAPDSPLEVFLLSTRAGGLGVNLQTADTVILYDSDWNPQADLQAMARCHRIGQKRVVHVYRLVTQGTIEERLVERAEKKLFLDQMVNRDSLSTGAANSNGSSGNGGDEGGGTKAASKLGSHGFAHDNGDVDNSELLSMLTFGANEICTSAAGLGKLTDADVDRIISRQDPRLDTGSTHIGADTSTSTSASKGKDSTHTQQFTAQSFDPLVAPLDTRNFQGQVFKKREDDGISFRCCSSSMKNIDCALQDREMGLESGSKRQSVSRLKSVSTSFGGTQQVLRANDYTMQTGEPSVMQSELGQNPEFAASAKPMKRKTLRAGVDYDNEDLCLSCWDGGDLMCCDFCPASYHSQCLTAEQLKGATHGWICPHHKCTVCGRNTSAAGGMLFRCSECPQCFCEDHLPSEQSGMQIIGRCVRMEAGGFVLPRQACYVRCSAACTEWADKLKAPAPALTSTAAAPVPVPVPTPAVAPVSVSALPVCLHEVKEVLKHKCRKRQRLTAAVLDSVQFLVRWKGYGTEDDTWETGGTLVGNMYLHAYLRKIGRKDLIPSKK